MCGVAVPRLGSARMHGGSGAWRGGVSGPPAGDASLAVADNGLSLGDSGGRAWLLYLCSEGSALLRDGDAWLAGLHGSAEHSSGGACAVLDASERVWAPALDAPKPEADEEAEACP